METLLALLGAVLVRGILLLGGYIESGNSFPQPLSAEEEAYYLARMKAGDIEARNILLEHNLRLVKHIANKYENTREDPDDLMGAGTVGLIKGVLTYDPEKGTRLATYAARCIENEIRMYLRSVRRHRWVSIHQPIGVDREGNEITLMDILRSDVDVAEEVGLRFDRERAMACLSKLPRRERQVLELRLGENGERRTQREIAKLMRISRSYVSRIEKRAIMHIFALMEAD